MFECLTMAARMAARRLLGLCTAATLGGQHAARLLAAPARLPTAGLAMAACGRRARGPKELLPARQTKAPPGCRGLEVMAKDGSLWHIFIGKSAADNDRLSLEIGRPDEPWMHVGGGIPGSHLIVRQAGDAGLGRPPRAVLEQAAGLVAFYSKARSRSTVEVHLTKCGQVSKRPGAPTGQVMLRGGCETLRVAPLDPATLPKAEALPKGDKNQPKGGRKAKPSSGFG
mmetsp:Transcript_373/g.855  ORF Transcript_373/g.855 Transcript_373/m.855 type:complete len:227 (+) Transcript_373:84-764(+)